MPCACRIPLESYPLATEWGPILWRILHGSAERAGTTPFVMYQADEVRLWINLLKQTAKILPCPTCSEHYRLYLAENPVDVLKQMDYSTIRDWIRRWLWILHNEVNQSFGKPVFSLASLPATYGRTDIRAALRELEAPMKRAITINGAQLGAWKEWKTTLTKLLATVGC